MAYVVPQVTVVFESFDTELPWLTRALMAISDFLGTWGTWLAGALVALIVLAALALRAEPVRIARDHVVLAIPFLGRQGEALSHAMGSSGRFPPLVVRLIAGGEKSGNLEQVLGKAAEIQEREVDTAASVFTAVLEPLMILAVGGMVLLIVLAILLPIFQLNQLLR